MPLPHTELRLPLVQVAERRGRLGGRHQANKLAGINKIMPIVFADDEEATLMFISFSSLHLAWWYRLHCQPRRG
jgi:hypothetical protein